MTKRLSIVAFLTVFAIVLAMGVPLALDRLWGNVPIVFYGRIVDQHGKGVAGVRVNASATVEKRLQVPALFTANGYQAPVSATSDHEGNFTIRGVKGTSLTLNDFVMPGFEEPAYIKRHFIYSGGYVDAGLARNPNAPYVYDVWCDGPTEPLIMDGINFRPQRDGREYSMNLLTCKIVEGDTEADIRFCIRSPAPPRGSHAPFDWSFSIEAVRGGLLETKDTFMFKAPDAGYTARYDYTFPSAGPAWSNVLKRDYYVRSRDGKVFAAVKLVLSDFPDGPGLNIGYVANPAGSRNLQPDRLKQIWVRH